MTDMERTRSVKVVQTWADQDTRIALERVWENGEDDPYVLVTVTDEDGRDGVTALLSRRTAQDVAQAMIRMVNGPPPVSDESDAQRRSYAVGCGGAL